MTTMTSTPSTIFWQWYNQSYNLAVNYANRNASNTMTNTQVGMAYTGAVLSSCTIAMGLRQFTNNLLLDPKLVGASRILVSSCVPYFSVALAGALNVALMRYTELEGITVTDEEGNPLGDSAMAGKQALISTAISRIALPLPVLALPPIVVAGFKSANIWPKNPRVAFVANLAVTTAALSLALPGAIALFPQRMEVPATDLEPKFHNLTDHDGNKINTIYFNKGL